MVVQNKKFYEKNSFVKKKVEKKSYNKKKKLFEESKYSEHKN